MVVGGGLRILACLLLACSSGAAAPTPTVVDARDYVSFWLWAGVRPQPALEGADRVYLLQAEVEDGAPARLVSRRPAVPHVRQAEVWMVIRAATLDWSPEIRSDVNRAIARWRAAGNRVAGVQIDFDAGTRHLETYAAFLKDLRPGLPAGCKLGITGLLDWSANSDPAGLDALAGIVDEVVLQTYQGRHVIPGYAAYFQDLDRLKIPFRVGLLQGGEWQPPSALARNPFFRGYVVFLRNG